MNSKHKIQGYIFVDEDSDEFSAAKAGDEIIKPDKNPPYLVVNHFLHKVILNRWPGKLYKVEVLDEGSEEEKEINKGLVKGIWYTRTFGVRILEELPLAHFFGQNGEKICQLVDLATHITSNEVELLNTYSLEESRILYSKAWKNWIALTDIEYADKTDDWSYTLAAHPKGQKMTSPIGYGLSLVWGQCYRRALQLEGNTALDIDEDGETSLNERWSLAAEHLLCAAISYESNNLLAENEKIQLRKPVYEVFNSI